MYTRDEAIPQSCVRLSCVHVQSCVRFHSLSLLRTVLSSVVYSLDPICSSCRERVRGLGSRQRVYINMSMYTL